MVSDFSGLCVGGGAGERTRRGGSPSFKQGQSITTFRIPKYKFWSWVSSDSGPPYFYCGKGRSYILISDKFKRIIFATVYTEEIQGVQLWKGVDKSLIVLHERPKTEVLFLSAVPTEVVIRKVNEAARGWVGYFRYGNCTKALVPLKRYLVYRMRIYQRRKHPYSSFGYKAYPDRYYFDSLGLYEVPTKAP